MLPDPAANSGTPPPAGADPALAELRLRRLEDCLANLQNSEWLAEHIAQRVSQRIEDRLASNGAARPAQQTQPVPVAQPFIPPAESSWFLPDLIREGRAIARMFFDPGYRVNPLTWIVVLLTLPVVLLSYWIFPGSWIPLVGPYLEKVFILVIAFVAFKALSREARRYQQYRGGS